MQPKFNFYDFVGYIIPGTLGALFVMALLSRVLGIVDLSLHSISGFGESLLFLILSYFLGHLIQARGRVVEQQEVARWGGWPSEQFLRHEDVYYTPEFKEKLLAAAADYFGLKPPATGNLEVEQRHRQELFNLCYTLIIQKGIGQHTEIYNGIYGLWRGLLVSFQIGFLVFLLEGLKRLGTIAYTWYASKNFIINRGILNDLLLSLIAMFFFGACLHFARSRFRHFGERFADSVYRNFLTYYQSIKETSKVC